MKSFFIPWVYLAGLTGSQVLGAAVTTQPLDGLLEYRQGEYFQAAQNISKYAAGDNGWGDYYTGYMRLYGFGLLKNNTLALRYITKAAEHGVLPAQQWLGKYYLYNNKPDIALNWFKKAAAQSDYSSQMYSTAAYMFGYGTSKNPDAARKYYLELARKGDAMSQYILGMDFLNDPREKQSRKLGVIWLNKAAEQGLVQAINQLGHVYWNGKVEKADVDVAEGYFKRAAKLNDVDAQLALAQMYADPKSRLADAHMAFEWAQKAADQGNSTAQTMLAEFYQAGSGVAADEKQAQFWQSKAKESLKHEKEAANLNTAEMVASWLTQGKARRFENTIYALGGVYTSWHSAQALQENNYNPSPQLDKITRQALYQPQFTFAQPKDIPISDYFDFLASHQTDSGVTWVYPRYPIDSQVQSLEDSHSFILEPAPWISPMDEGRTLPSYPQTELPGNYLQQLTANWELLANYQQVITYLYQRAVLGDADAQYKLGQLYQYGIVLGKNIPQAITYYELAALQQDVRAEYDLGVLYLEGKTDPVNYQKGLDWIMDAAFKGNSYAQYVLAHFYEVGLIDPSGQVIVAKNPQQAIAMYYLASSNQYSWAQYRLATYLAQENNAVLSVQTKNNRAALVRKLYQSAAQAGIAEAMLPATFYQAVDPNPETQKQAFAVAEEQANAGVPLASLLLGMMYERGIGVAADQKEAVHWFEQAGIDPVSAFILGTYTYQGEVMSKDQERGRTLLQQSAGAGFPYAMYNLAMVKKQANEPFIAELDKAREAGNSKAGLLLADYYLLQASDPDKMQQARAIYQHFADKGDQNAQLKLAFLYDRGLGGPADLQLAAQWYTLSAKQGQPLAQYLLGMMYQLGRIGDGPNYTQTKKWYALAQAAYAPAAVALGFVLDTVDDDYTAAAESYSLAAQRGDAVGQYNLGLIYLAGKGQAFDLKKAQEYFKKAADQGLPAAMAQLASLYFYGVDGQKDEDQALHWYQKAAQLGNREANYQLGLFSETGVAMKLDFPVAVKYYQEAANRGDEKAALALARIYQFGLGTPKDIAHAADIYKSLAANNNAFAQYQLAVLYYEGSLGEKKLDEGKRLLMVARDNGSTQADHMLQWLDAQQEQKVSFVLPIGSRSVDLGEVDNQENAERMYLDALSQWNRGDETMLRCILNRLVKQFPQYTPAKKIYEQLSAL